MKILSLILLFILNAQLSFAADTPAPESRAVEINFYGGLTGFDESSYRILKSSMASLLAEGIIDQFKTSFWGREGGSSFCVELGLDPKIKIELVTRLLEAIQARFNSYYTYALAQKCP